MKLLIVLTLLSSMTFGSESYVSDCTELKTDCEYYLCIEASKKCGRKGYLKSFGHKYCQKFSHNIEQDSSKELRDWAHETKECLIRSISNLDPNLTCRKLKRKAFRQHKSCYVNSGFCSLKRRDKNTIIKTIGFGLLKPRTIITGIGVIRSCLRGNKVSL